MGGGQGGWKKGKPFALVPWGGEKKAGKGTLANRGRVSRMNPFGRSRGGGKVAHKSKKINQRETLGGGEEGTRRFVNGWNRSKLEKTRGGCRPSRKKGFVGCCSGGKIKKGKGMGNRYIAEPLQRKLPVGADQLLFGVGT